MKEERKRERKDWHNEKFEGGKNKNAWMDRLALYIAYIPEI